MYDAQNHAYEHCVVRTYCLDDCIRLDVLALGSVVDGLHASVRVAVIAGAGLHQLKRGGREDIHV